MGTGRRWLPEDRCDRVLTATVPLDLGRPRAGGKVDEVNAAIEASAETAGALVLDCGNSKVAAS